MHEYGLSCWMVTGFFVSRVDVRPSYQTLITKTLKTALGKSLDTRPRSPCDSVLMLRLATTHHTRLHKTEVIWPLVEELDLCVVLAPSTSPWATECAYLALRYLLAFVSDGFLAA